MPLQNRVNPFGEIIATPERGMFVGNRGIIHDPATRTLMKRRWTTKTWIICVCEFKGRHREVMARRSWTELFFLDEATAFAAGHRPCFECRRADANRFRAAWEEGNRTGHKRAPEIDEVLHRERVDGKTKRLHALPSLLDELPDGTMVAADNDCGMVVGGRMRRWSFAGYGEVMPARDDMRLLTPPSVVNAFRAGYRPLMHASASE